VFRTEELVSHTVCGFVGTLIIRTISLRSYSLIISFLSSLIKKYLVCIPFLCHMTNCYYGNVIPFLCHMTHCYYGNVLSFRSKEKIQNLLCFVIKIK
jgi:hypothetical protein